MLQKNWQVVLTKWPRYSVGKHESVIFPGNTDIGKSVTLLRSPIWFSVGNPKESGEDPTHHSTLSIYSLPWYKLVDRKNITIKTTQECWLYFLRAVNLKVSKFKWRELHNILPHNGVKFDTNNWKISGISANIWKYKSTLVNYYGTERKSQVDFFFHCTKF